MSQVHFWWFPETFEFSKNLVFCISKSINRWLGMEHLSLLRSECFGTDRTVPVGCLRNCWDCFTLKRSEQLRLLHLRRKEHIGAVLSVPFVRRKAVLFVSEHSKRRNLKCFIPERKHFLNRHYDFFYINIVDVVILYRLSRHWSLLQALCNRLLQQSLQSITKCFSMHT